MPIYNEAHKSFYSTSAETLKIFRDEQKKKCECCVMIWAGNENKFLICIRKTNLESELQKKGLWSGNKHLKYWKVRRQGQYKELKIAPVYPQSC